MGSWDQVPRLEIAAGRLGFFSLLNGNRVPAGGLTVLRNASLADRSWRTGGGATKLGTPISGAPRGIAALDYWPTLAQERTIVVGSDGKIWKDDGNGGGWATLQAGLTTAGAVPMFAVAGSEVAGNNRKLYYADRVNATLFLDGDGGAMAALPAPNVDWAGANQPGWFCPHQSYNWAGGNPNAPHTVYRSLITNHGDFNTTAYRLICGPLPNQERTVGAISYKGGLIVFAYPTGVYFVDTTTDADPAHWFAALVARAGCAGPRAFAQVEEDVIYMAADGSWHSLSSIFGQQKASIRASDISYKALTTWQRANMNLAQAAQFDLVYYDDQQEIMLAYAPTGATLKTRRLHADLSGVAEAGGPNWLTWDRDDNAALFLRKASDTVMIPAMIDSVGQAWLLDQPTRSAAGQPYTFEFFTQDTDFSGKGRKLNGRFVQVEYVAINNFTLTLEAWMDGVLRQTIAFVLTGAGAVLPVNLPFQLGGLPILSTPYQRLLGQFRRLALRGYVTGPAGADCCITKLVVGAEPGP